MFSLVFLVEILPKKLTFLFLYEHAFGFLIFFGRHGIQGEWICIFQWKELKIEKFPHVVGVPFYCPLATSILFTSQRK